MGFYGLVEGLAKKQMSERNEEVCLFGRTSNESSLNLIFYELP